MVNLMLRNDTNMKLLPTIFILFLFFSVTFAKIEVLLLPLKHFGVDQKVITENNELLQKGLNLGLHRLGTVVLLNKEKYHCDDVICAKNWGKIFQTEQIIFPRIIRRDGWNLQLVHVDLRNKKVHARTIKIPYGIYKMEEITENFTRYFAYRLLNKNDDRINVWIDTREIVLKPFEQIVELRQKGTELSLEEVQDTISTLIDTTVNSVPRIETTSDPVDLTPIVETEQKKN